MKRGQFGNVIVDVIFWLLIISLFIWFIRIYIVGSADGILGPADIVLS